MAGFFYDIFLFLFGAGIRLASLWNPKAGLWISGRKDILQELQSKVKSQNSKLIWFHCSSLGEFEQGRPVLEKLKSQRPDCKFLLTFFSPSGFEIRKNFNGADWVYYLPIDSKQNAKRFFDIVNPSLVVFVKYDYWYYYLAECKKRDIPLLMISAIFRRDQPFFKWYGSLHRQMLICFTHFFVQDNHSKELLASLPLHNVTVAGDSRFDRVTEIAERFKPVKEIENFIGHSALLVAGSTWPADEKMIKEASACFPDLKLIIAPHEIDKEHIDQLKSIFTGAILYSQLKVAGQQPANCLIVDNIGMLSRLYHYATIAYVGGGFNKGIHNTLEAAVYGRPVLFGPNYKKFIEAINLVESGGGISVTTATGLSSALKKLLTDKKEWELRCLHSSDFVRQHTGATGKITSYIEANRLLTS